MEPNNTWRDQTAGSRMTCGKERGWRWVSVTMTWLKAGSHYDEWWGTAIDVKLRHHRVLPSIFTDEFAGNRRRPRLTVVFVVKFSACWTFCDCKITRCDSVRISLTFLIFLTFPCRTRSSLVVLRSSLVVLRSSRAAPHCNGDMRGVTIFGFFTSVRF